MIAALRLAKSFVLAVVATAVVAALVCGCSGADPDSKQTAAAHGEALYRMNCQACHEGKNLELIKQPPSLAGLFQRQKLPSGIPTSDEAVRKTIREGRGIMPPFQQTLDKNDVTDLVQYLHTLRTTTSARPN